ncbi:uncharacterized protein SAPINGB_P002171 [Magnusiomyces paraingens]|uniref:Uncharacterized protein n=1 Tax=Magnusiomyces paraingens TaxID=2606893 RepID=A0A5E8BI71_9ASCO|nr:uncharacterized protein SAPINGB_P002171 [Saprochaete ingens]VVT49238.1 unnamed protein product [Saprochaete ingens]
MWSHDYCTVCDKQCPPGTMYCSDVCRVRELNKSCEVSSSSDSVYSSLYTTTRHHSLSSPLPACEGINCTSTTCVCSAPSSPLAIPHSHHHSSRCSSSDADYFFGGSQSLFYNSSNCSSSSSPCTPELSPALTISSASPLSIQSSEYLYAGAPRHAMVPSNAKNDTTQLSPPPSPLMIPSSYYYKSSTASNGNEKTSPYKLSERGHSTASEYTNTSSNYRRWLSAV